MSDKKIVDHKGNKYKSITQMAESYGITLAAYYSRLKKAWPLEKILTTPLNKYGATDHLGNKFTSIEEMCKHYNIKSTTFKARIRDGWSVEKALTKQPEETFKKKKMLDHKGNEYESLGQLAKAYNIDRRVLSDRLNRQHWDMEKALTTKVRS